jgi:hypothetical protein
VYGIDFKWGSFANKLKHFLGLDRAIGFTVFGRCFTALASAVTVVLISRIMSPIDQGYYYAIWSLCALQIIFELGFSFVILQVAAHERACLNISSNGTLQGDVHAIKRLAGLLRTVQRWYLFAAVAMVIMLILWGFHFFSARPSQGVYWQLPWVLAVLASAMTFQIAPTISFLEGCGYVTDVAAQRLIQTVAGSITGWAAVVLRHGLYAPGCIIGVQAISGLWLFYRHRRLLLQLLREDPKGHTISWRREILPFQWRVALSWLCGFVPNTFFTPLLFAVRGPIEAGKMGLSMNISLSLGIIGLSWMTTKSAPFGNLVARGEGKQLDSLFFRTLKQSTALVSTGAVIIFLCIGIIDHIFPSIGHRMVGQLIFSILLLTTVFNHIVQSEALYLRSHKTEPFLYLSIAIAVFLTVSSWIGAKWAGSLGVAYSYFLCSGIAASIGGTVIFTTKRRSWGRGAEVRS